jgi:hypothetical protein
MWNRKMTNLIFRNMKMKKSMIMVLAVTALCGCLPEQEASDATDNIYSDVPVELTAVVGTGAGTRGAVNTGVINEVKNGDSLRLTIFRADQNTTDELYTYTNRVSGDLIGYDNESAITNTSLKYFTDNRKSKFWALYPTMTGFAINNDRYVTTWTFSGDVDLMGTDFVCGSRYNPITDSQQLTFKHLFTRYDIYIKAKEGSNIVNIGEIYKRVNYMQFYTYNKCKVYTPLANDDDDEWLLTSTGDRGWIRINKSNGVDGVITENATYITYVLLPPFIVDVEVIQIGTESNVFTLLNVHLVDNPIAGKTYKLVFEFMDDGTVQLGGGGGTY